MAKRFLDTGIWSKPWFRKLKPVEKCFVLYLFSNCDHAGLWEADLETASYFIGQKIDDPFKFLPDSFHIIVHGCKWFIPKFITYQYGDISSEKPVCKSVVNILERQGLTDVYNEYLNGSITIAQPPTNTLKGIKVKDKDKDKDKVKDKDRKKTNTIPESLNTPEFIEAWEEWNQYKRQRKQTLTAVGISRQLKKLDEWGVVRAVSAIHHTIEKGWTGIYEKTQGNNGSTRNKIGEPVSDFKGEF